MPKEAHIMSNTFSGLMTKALRQKPKHSGGYVKAKALAKKLQITVSIERDAYSTVYWIEDEWMLCHYRTRFLINYNHSNFK